jgi:hypothetical protein
VRLSILAAFAVSAPLAAQAAPPPACDAPEHHQFDFWIGDWNVTAQDKPAGTNQITAILNGCVLHEHWAGTKGFKGESFNYYDRTEGTWNQVWVDQGGNALRLSGHFANGVMELAGDGRQPDGKPIRQRIRWSRNADGSVRQLWDSSTDGGKSWQVQFDGVYRKR